MSFLWLYSRKWVYVRECSRDLYRRVLFPDRETGATAASSAEGASPRAAQTGVQADAGDAHGDDAHKMMSDRMNLLASQTIQPMPSVAATISAATSTV